MATMVERHRVAKRRQKLETQRQIENMKDDDVLEPEAAKEMATILIARRIVLEISDEALVERLGGYEVTQALSKMKAGEKRDIRTYHEARRIEHDLLTNGRLSTFQRYARVVGLRLDVGMQSEEAIRKNRRWQRSPVRMSRYIRSRRRYLATKYGKVRHQRSHF